MMKALLAFLLLFAASAEGAITLVQSTNTSTAAGASTKTVTFSSTPTAGNFVFIVSAIDNSASINCSATNIVFSEITRNTTNSVAVHVAIGRVQASPGSTVTLTSNIGSVNFAIVAAEYTSSVGTIRLDKQTGAVGSSTTPASGSTETTSSGTVLWLGAFAARGQLQNTISGYSSGFTEITSGQTWTTLNVANSDRTVAVATKTSSTSGATASCSATLGATNNWVAEILAFDEVATSGGAGKRSYVATLWQNSWNWLNKYHLLHP